jgi:hypothetical protein
MLVSYGHPGYVGLPPLRPPTHIRPPLRVPVLRGESQLLTAAKTPSPTAEYQAIAPQPGESGLDALTRVGDGIVAEVGGDDSKDPSRKDKKLPRQLAALVALRAQGFDNQEIADRLGVPKRRLNALIAKARKEYGWDDLADKLAHQAIPLAIDATIKHIEYEGSKEGVMEGRSTMTRAALGGVGVFKSHSAAKVEQKSTQERVLRVEISLPQLPPGAQGALSAAGSVLATPRRALAAVNPTPVAPLEGEVVSE